MISAPLNRCLRLTAFAITTTSLSACVHFSSLPPVAQIGPGGTTLITHARLFSGSLDQPVQNDVDVLIANGVITQIGPHPLNATAEKTVDASGKTLIPGLIDLHAHVGASESPPWQTTLQKPERTLSSFLVMGVTTVVDLGGVPQLVGKMNDKLNSGEIAGPRLAYTGKQISVKDSHPAPLFREALKWPLGRIAGAMMIDTVNADTDFDALIAEKKARGSSLIKLMIDQIPADSPELPLSLAKRAVEAAHRAGLPVAAHVGSEANLLTALDAGVDIVAHTAYRSPLANSSIDRLKSSGATQVSTLRVFNNISTLAQRKSPVNADDAKLMAPEIREAFENPKEENVSPIMRAYAEQVAKHNEVMFENCRKIRQSGTPMVMGTDSPLMGSAAGASAHAELELMVERCGFSPLEALAAATGAPGKIVGKWLGLTGLGRIEVGAPADLLLVEGDPTRQIRDTRRIVAVFSRGKAVERMIP